MRHLPIYVNHKFRKMSPQEYEKRSDEIMEAIRSGKFIYDMSGSAR
jgi:hypothetical protein